MKTYKLFILTASIVMLFDSCAKNLMVNYQPNSENTGSIVIAPTGSLEGSVLTIDNKLLVDKKFIKKITVNNVPTGDHQVNFSCDSWSYKENLNEKFTVKTEKDKEYAKIVTKPPYSTGYYLVWGLEAILDVVLILSLHP